ncbi:hypothetical protein [Candidatus Accumulibacter sp. ACC003]|uniref:hypothetical protein n=1 Tax=Candidatus Accumulibacter sp. ACC003 TaxID=2823334 RepID=UPI0025BA11EC|nr:hypothetical protein [Candidatus Accumulibacter sp. ACC003]
MKRQAHYHCDENRSRIRTAYGPANISCLRRFTVGILQHFSDGKTSLAEKMRPLKRNI